MQFQDAVDPTREQPRRPYFIIRFFFRPLGRQLLELPQMRRGEVDAPPVAPRYQRSGHEGAAHRNRGAGDRRVPGQSCCCLKVDEERRRVRDKGACELVWWASRAARQAYGAADRHF